MATVTVDQAALVLNSFCALLENKLVSGDIAKWNEHSGELDDTNKLIVHEQFGPRYTVTKTTDGVKDLSSGVDDSVFGSEVFKVNSTYNANMGWGDFIKVRDVGAARESEALTGAASSMAHKIDADILQAATLASADWVGSAGALIDDFDEFDAAYTRLMENGVDDSNLYGVLLHADRQALGTQIGKLSAPDAEASKAIRKGFSGDLNGVPLMFTNQLPSLTTGSRVGTIKVNGASQNVDYADVANSSSPGYYMTQTIAIDGLTNASDTVKAGEVFTIDGVYAYDNRKQAAVSPARLQQFTVVADATASTNAIAALRIYPAIIVAGSGSGGDVNVNTAHATVTAAPADNANVTFMGSASTAYTPRLLIQKGAVSVDTIPLIMPATGKAMRRKLDNVPITVRMWQHSDFGTGAHSVRFDCALTTNVRDRRRICRVNGAS